MMREIIFFLSLFQTDMPYVEAKGSIPSNFKDALMSGVSVPLMIGTTGKVFLTREQHKRYAHAVANGRKSIKVRMSPLQARHNLTHGEGFWGDVWSGIKAVGKFLKSDLGKKVSDTALDIASSVAPSYAPALQSAKEAKKSIGFGVRKARKPKAKAKGKGVRAVGSSGRGIIAV
jgi:hypothetical protein